MKSRLGTGYLLIFFTVYRTEVGPYQPLQMLLINRNKRYRQQQQQLARAQHNLELDDPKPIRRFLSVPRIVLGKGP